MEESLEKQGDGQKIWENDKWCVIWKIYEKLFSWAFFNKRNVEKASKPMDCDFERYIQDCQGDWENNNKMWSIHPQKVTSQVYINFFLTVN